MSDSEYCPHCEGQGTTSTGIAEWSRTVCTWCAGTGLKREAEKYQCSECGRIMGWDAMQIRYGIRNCCPSCYQRGYVGTMSTVSRPTVSNDGENVKG